LSMNAARHAASTTELYFINTPQAQPAGRQSDSHMTLPFAVRDPEGRTASYAYRVSFVDSHGITILDEGVVAVTDQQVHVVNPDVTIPAGTSQGLVQVALVGTNEAISYWLERTV